VFDFIVRRANFRIEFSIYPGPLLDAKSSPGNADALPGLDFGWGAEKEWLRAFPGLKIEI